MVGQLWPPGLEFDIKLRGFLPGLHPTQHCSPATVFHMFHVFKVIPQRLKLTRLHI